MQLLRYRSLHAGKLLVILLRLLQRVLPGNVSDDVLLLVVPGILDGSHANTAVGLADNLRCFVSDDICRELRPDCCELRPDRLLDMLFMQHMRRAASDNASRVHDMCIAVQHV